MVFTADQAKHGVRGCCAAAGGELFEHIGKRAAFTEAAAAEVARSLLQYLAHIHGLGVAHMDIKPENIMFDTQGADGVLKVSPWVQRCCRRQGCRRERNARLLVLGGVAGFSSSQGAPQLCRCRHGSELTS